MTTTAADPVPRLSLAPDLPSGTVFRREDLTAPIPPCEFLLDQRIPTRKVTLLAGSGGAGKTSFLAGLALHRGLGLDFLGMPTRRGATAFVSLEDSTSDYRSKLATWVRADPRLSDGADQVGVLDLGADAAIAVEPCGLVLQPRRGGFMVNITFVDSIACAIGALHRNDGSLLSPDLVVIETASRFGAGDESNGAAAALMLACERIARRCATAVLLVHHTGKQQSRDRVIDAHSGRGASAFGDNARSVLYLGAPNKQRLAAFLRQEPTDALIDRWIVLANTKSNFAARAEDVFLNPLPVTAPGATGSIGLVFARVGAPDAASVAVAAAAEADRRATVGRSMAAAVERLGALGVPATARALRDLPKGERPVPKARIGAALADAVADGFLVETDERQGIGVVYAVARSGPSRPEPDQTRAGPNGVARPEVLGAAGRASSSFDPFETEESA